MNSKGNVEKKNNKKNKKKRSPFRFLLYDFVILTGFLPVLIALRPKLLYENDKAKKRIRGGAIAIANHTSFVDPVAMFCAFWYRHVHSIVTEDLFRRKIFRWFFSHTLCIPVKRNDFNIDAFHRAVDVVENGGLLSLFPEGGINFDSDKVDMKSFKSGAVLMALKGHVPIVPVRIIPQKKWYNRTVIVIGEKINPEELYSGMLNVHAMENISQKLREKELELKEIYEKWKATK